MNRTTTAIAALFLTFGVGACSSTQGTAGTATAIRVTSTETIVGTGASTDFGTPESFVESTIPTVESSQVDTEPAIDVAGPTLDDYYPNFVGVFGPDEAYRCIWFSNPQAVSITIESVGLTDQLPTPGFGFGVSAPPPVCRDYLTDTFAPVDVRAAQYGGCTGVELPALADPSGVQPRPSCAVRIDVLGGAGTDWTGTLVLTLTTSCKDPGAPPCDQVRNELASHDQPVLVRWEHRIPIAACLDTGDTHPGCVDPGDESATTPSIPDDVAGSTVFETS